MRYIVTPIIGIRNTPYYIVTDTSTGNVGDTIYRQDAIDALNRFSLGETDAMKLFLRMDDYLKKLPPAQPQQWIPCSERLPKHSYTKKFWLTVKTDDDTLETVIGEWSSWCIPKTGETYDAFTCWSDSLINGNIYRLSQPIPAEKVIAWIPAPEPYREESNEQRRSN